MSLRSNGAACFPSLLLIARNSRNQKGQWTGNTSFALLPAAGSVPSAIKDQQADRKQSLPTSTEA